MKSIWWFAALATLSDCKCAGNYPKGTSGAELQQDALSMRVSADTLVFARNNLEQILRSKFKVDDAGYIEIPLPEATDASAEQFCDEQTLFSNFPRCDYSIRLRDGCMGPGAQANGLCPPLQVGADNNVNYVRRETYRSSVKIKLHELAKNLTFEMQPAGPLDTGGIHLRLTNIEIDLDAAIYAKIPELLGFTLGDFTCRYHKQDGAAHAVKINKLDLTMQPRVEYQNGKPGLFATTVINDVDLGGFALDASTIADDPACTAGSAAGLPCSAACGAMGFLLGGASTVVNAVLSVLTPALPYLLTPIGNVLLAFMWGEVVELGFDLPTADLPWVPKGVGRNIQMLANAQDGAFKVSQIGSGLGDPSMGMTIPFAMGAFAQRSPCVPDTLAPPITTNLVPPKMDGIVDLTAADGTTVQEPYHLGLQISESYLNTLAWAMQGSGMLCAALGSDPGGLLSTGDFVPTAGLLYLLAPPLNNMAPASAPIFFRTVPSSNAYVVFGTGKEIGKDQNGKPIIESLIKLSLLDMGVEFHLFAWDRFVRAFELQIDAQVGLSVHAATDGKLTVSIDSINVDNVRDIYNELMPGYDFSKITQVLFSVLSSQLNGGQLSFEVPLQQMLKDALGGSASARVLDVRTGGAGNGFLSAFVKLCSVADEQDRNNFGCYVPQPVARDVLSLRQVEYGTALTPELRALRARGVPLGVVALQVENGDVGRQYQAAVDSEIYGRFTEPGPDGVLKIESPMLQMLGRHRLRIRTRQAGGPIDLHSPVIELDVLVDPERPRLVVNNGKIVASDLVTPADKLLFQVGDSTWVSREEAERILQSAEHSLTVVAKDEAGNLSSDPDFSNVVSPQKQQGCGQAGSPLWLVLVLAMYLNTINKFVRRQRTR